ncbi:MAG: hypothetical protein ABIR96_02985 [Bdellovibrionota bacterium]
MRKIFFTLSLFAIASFSHGTRADNVTDFTGHWAGTGQMIQRNPWTGNKTEPCSKIDITIVQVSDRFTMQHYDATCGMIAPDWGPMKLEIHGSKLVEHFEGEEPEEVGGIEGNVLKTIFHESATYAFNLRLNAPVAPSTAPTLDSYYGVQNGAGTIVIEGRLDPVSP